MSLLTNIAAYFKCDEASGNLVDAVAALNLTQNGTIGAAAGKLNNGRVLDGTAMSFSRAEHATYRAGNISFTWSLWVKTSVLDGFGSAIYKVNTNFSADYAAGITDVFYFTKTDDAFNTANLSSPTLVVDTWNHFIFGYDLANTRVFLIQNNGTPQYATVTFGTTTHDAPIHIGGNDFASLNGMIDEIGFWKKVLSADEITALYGNGTPPSFDDFASLPAAAATNLPPSTLGIGIGIGL